MTGVARVSSVVHDGSVSDLGDPLRAAEAWAELRRRGVSVGLIGREFGVTHQWVSRVTAPLGPFPRAGTPAAEQVEDWIAQRRSGRSIERVARSAGVPRQRVAEATAVAGPFRRRLAEPGWLTVTDAAWVAGVSGPALLRWEALGRMPPPDARRGRRRLWREDTIRQWLETSPDLERCGICGARSFSVSRHFGAAHRSRQ